MVEIQAFNTKWGNKQYLALTLWLVPIIIWLAISPFWAFITALVISGFYWILKLSRKNKFQIKSIDGNENFVAKVQHDLNLEFAYFSYKPDNKKIVFGGFMIPFLPFYSKVRSRLSFPEATIHEHYHIWWMVYGFQTAVVYLLLSLVSPSGWHKYAVIFGWLMVQEFLAFNSTKKYAQESIGLKTRSFDMNVIAKYTMFYGSLLTCFALAKIYLAPHISPLTYMVALIGILIGLAKLWYRIWLKMGLITEVV